jgi:superfamily II DNA/RNA helicase
MLCSGKTAGYLIPALSHVREARKRAIAEGRTLTGKEGAPVLVLAPTRELAKQIDQEAMKFGGALGLRTA